MRGRTISLEGTPEVQSTRAREVDSGRYNVQGRKQGRGSLEGALYVHNSSKYQEVEVEQCSGEHMALVWSREQVTTNWTKPWRVLYQIIRTAIPSQYVIPAPPAPSQKNRLTHYPTANTLSNQCCMDHMA